MKITGKIITVIAMSVGIVQIVCPEKRFIVAYKDKSMDLGKDSAVHIYQNGRLVSRQAFPKQTPASGAKALFFDTSNGDVTIQFYHFAGETNEPSATNAVGAVTPSVRTFQVADIPKKSKIKISGEKYSNGNNIIEIEPATVRVNVVKDPKYILPGDARIRALKVNSTTPTPAQIYDTILARNLSTRRLHVPSGKTFWVSVPLSPSTVEITPMSAKDVTTNSVINIDAQGRASWGN